MHESNKAMPTTAALPVLLAALIGLVSVAGADLLSPIVLAIILLPVCEAAQAASNAADEEAAPAIPERRRPSWHAAAAIVILPRTRVPVHRGVLNGVLLPLLA